MAKAFIGIAWLLAITLGMGADAAPLLRKFSLAKLTGGSIKSEQLNGKPYILQFWASWCDGCDKTMVSMQNIARGHNGLKFLPVSVDESEKQALTYFQRGLESRQEMKHLAYFDQDQSLATALGITAIPSIVLVDGKGNIAMTITGHPSFQQIQSLQAQLEIGAKK